ncbi:shematrin-like protein 1 [Drosophila subobscura]|uniref:shematrin-like protein 1 n=1 Tax=Drosophila subobscura TaxID=7241 RepID=UPI00155A8EE2|nr:shematrin-like protein 1 [Drosophila subobscura]
MKIHFLSILGYLLVGCAALSQASFLPATAVGVPANALGVPAAVPPPTSYQFVARNWNRFYVPTATGVATYHPPATTYYKYNGGYPAYPTGYPSGYPAVYPSAYPYGYGYNPYYGYKSVW